MTREMSRVQGWIVIGLLGVVAVAVVLMMASQVLTMWQIMSQWPDQR